MILGVMIICVKNISWTWKILKEVLFVIYNMHNVLRHEVNV